MSVDYRRWLPAIDFRVIEFGLLSAVLIFNASALGKSIGAALQPRGLTYTEGVNAILATKPELWFQPVAQAPHFPTIYPLGYHALTHALMKLTGLSPFLIMHGIGLASAAGGALVIAKLVSMDTKYWWGPPTAALLYGLSPAVSGATVLGRVDHLGVALGLLAVLWARQHRLTAAALVTVASMYVKHSLIVFPVAITVWLLLTNDWRAVARYAGTVGVLGLAILAGLVIATNGQAWLHLVVYNQQHPWLWDVLEGQLIWFLYTHAIIAGAFAYFAIRGRVKSLPAVFAIVALLSALITVGKVGSWVGYFLPTIAAGAWLIGSGIEQVDLNRQHGARVVIVLLLVTQLGLYADWAGGMNPKYQADNQARAIAEIETIGGPILAEDGTLYVETGVEQVHEPLMMRFVYEYDSYAGDNLADEIRRQRFRRIIIGQSIESWQPGDTTRWHDDELEAMKENYVRVWAAGDYYVYAPAS